jgi:molybdenum cofactor cytidylyltransferase
MGRTKQLLRLGDKPVISHCIDAMLDAGISDCVVVVGAQENGITWLLRGLPVTIAVNDVPGSDMAESVRAGLKLISASSSGVLIGLSDHPLVSPETMKALIREHSAFPGYIIIPVYLGRRGHPSLFPIRALREIFFGSNLRDIVRQDPARVRFVDVQDEGVVLDMDTPDDYEAILKHYRSR